MRFFGGTALARASRVPQRTVSLSYPETRWNTWEPDWDHGVGERRCVPRCSKGAPLPACSGFVKVPSDPPPPVVLVVEDEWLLRQDVADALRADGLTVLEASNGDAAVRIFAESLWIDVLITDIRLGGRMTGWDVAQSFRAAHPRGGVIYASGSPPDPARRVPDSLFFSKPCNVALLLAACRRGGQE